GEGGMVVSNSQRLLDKIKDLRDYDQKKGYKVRYNYKMTDLEAALGISQLSQLNHFLKRRREIADFYCLALKGCPLQLPLPRTGYDHVYFRYVIKCKKSSRNQLMKFLEQRGIHCALPVFKPLHNYFALGSFPCTDLAQQQSLSIPIYPTLKNQEQGDIVKSIKDCFTTL
ncbi:MAG: DegT/DnrJ/EryC1/StrS family aminotransferase, partial [Candidatus Omnitrophica bacterium]|nr:DegT/DnrJ/EryC1/StrS family aminotransferase [Candidatus Omnitrophota bacterium]